MGFELGTRRGVVLDIEEELARGPEPLRPGEIATFEHLDLVYRTLCALMYNYAPTSGHPGGSISCGRFVAALLFDNLDVDLSNPNRADADIISFSAGHKALGLYAMWALRNEVARLGAPELLPEADRLQLRLEDLLGFRRNPVTATPLFRNLGVKALDGHPTPATPHVKLATGASGVGVAASLGLALGAADTYGRSAPWVHLVEGEGGLTPGRVSEAMAGAGTASLHNAVMHVDWNQAAIDSDRVCRSGGEPGDYVQWTPAELAAMHDWNVINVPDGTSFQQIVAAQRRALELDNGQPTAIIYRTTKGWRYGLEGRASHGAGHSLCSADFYAALEPFEQSLGLAFARCDAAAPPCAGASNAEALEQCYWQALLTVRSALTERPRVTEDLASRLRRSRSRLDAFARSPRDGAPRLNTVYEIASAGADLPDELRLEPGATTSLRGELGRALQVLNQRSGGALVIAAADLLGSTSVAAGGKGFPGGFFNARGNPGARLLTVGGICEDAIAGVMSGLSTFGRHTGVGSSYGAFIAPLGHIAARLHAIGDQARQEVEEGPGRCFILVLAHAGLKTGEDGPTHADPQALQLLQENFPVGTLISLTPWDPQEVWHLLTAALCRRPSVIAPVVTRPSETVLDRDALGLAPAAASRRGVYLLRPSQGTPDGTVVLQGSEVTYAFLQDGLPRLLDDGLDVEVYSIASVELFDLLPLEEKVQVYPEATARRAMGITGFTLPTLYRWITSERGRAASLHPFMDGRFLGSGPGARVLEQAGLDGRRQHEAVKRYVEKL